MKELITVAEFIGRDNGDIDIVDDVCEELYLAVCRPVKLTEEGKRHWREVLTYEVSIDEDHPEYCAVLCIDDDNEKVWKRKLRKALDFFWALAGYCDCDDYDRWIIEED